MRVLGIDCATKCGWSVVEDVSQGARKLGKDERLGAHGVLDLSGKKKSVSAVINEFVLTLPSIDVAVIELPYFDENVITLRTLARLVGRFEQVLEPLHVEVELVMATEWQHSILGSFGGKNREQLKKAAVLWARATFGVVLAEDEADAAGIATHLLRTRRFDARCASAAR